MLQLGTGLGVRRDARTTHSEEQGRENPTGQQALLPLRILASRADLLLSPALLLPGYTHIFKTDDDVFVRPQQLLATLHASAPPPKALAPGAPVAAAAAGEAVSATAAAAAGAASAAAAQQPPTPLQSQLREWARRTGKPLHSDGLAVYSADGMVRRAGAVAGEWQVLGRS